jgi:hypothetical protein
MAMVIEVCRLNTVANWSEDVNWPFLSRTRLALQARALPADD